MERQPAWLAATACGTLNSEVPSVRMPSLRRSRPALRAGPVAGILMQNWSLERPAAANSRA